MRPKRAISESGSGHLLCLRKRKSGRLRQYTVRAREPRVPVSRCNQGQTTGAFMFDYQDAEDPFYPTFEDPFYPAFNNPLWGDANVAWSRIAAAVFLIAILAVAIIGHLSQVGINTAFNDVTPPPAINHM